MAGKRSALQKVQAMQDAKAGVVAGEVLSAARRKQAERISPARVEGADLRVEMVLDMMAKGEWRGILTCRALARIWDFTPDSVEQYAADASRHLRLQFSPDRHEAIKAQLLAQIAEIGKAAMERTEEVLDIKGNVHEVRRPDMRTALAAVVECGTMLGIRTTKHEHRVTTADLSDAELHAKLAEIVAADPKLQESLGAMGFRREVQTTGETVEEPKK